MRQIYRNPRRSWRWTKQRAFCIKLDKFVTRYCSIKNYSLTFTSAPYVIFFYDSTSNHATKLLNVQSKTEKYIRSLLNNHPLVISNLLTFAFAAFIIYLHDCTCNHARNVHNFTSNTEKSILQVVEESDGNQSLDLQAPSNFRTSSPLDGQKQPPALDPPPLGRSSSSSSSCVSSQCSSKKQNVTG